MKDAIEGDDWQHGTSEFTITPGDGELFRPGCSELAMERKCYAQGHVEGYAVGDLP